MYTMDNDTITPAEALEQAIAAAGGLTALGKPFEISAPAVDSWRRGGVPANRVLEIERLTGVSRHLLRPDIYPRDGEDSAA